MHFDETELSIQVTFVYSTCTFSPKMIPVHHFIRQIWHVCYRIYYLNGACPWQFRFQNKYLFSEMILLSEDEFSTEDQNKSIPRRNGIRNNDKYRQNVIEKQRLSRGEYTNYKNKVVEVKTIGKSCWYVILLFTPKIFT